MFNLKLTNIFSVSESQVLGDRIPPFFVKKKFPVFFFLFGIFVINLCYIIREISLFHIIREISLFPPVYYPAPATININIRFLWWHTFVAQVNQKIPKRKKKRGKFFYTKKGGILSPSICDQNQLVNTEDAT